MTSHLKGVAKSTMSDQIRKELCEYKRDNLASTQKDLQRWLEGKFELKVSQGTISNTFKRSDDYLSAEIEKRRVEIKRHKPTKYPDMKKVIYEWFLQHQERVNITGELILQKARDTMKLVYPHDDSNFNFSIGWLGKFKHRHGIKSFCRFGETWTIDVRKETISNCFRHCKIRSASDVARNLDESTFDEETQDLETMINQCGYRNKMDINNLMNYPGENEACSEVQSLEDIVSTIIENNAEDDDEDDTMSLEFVMRKEALMASNILHNFMIQYKNTTPELLDAIRKVRDELQIDLNFKGKQTTIESYFNRV
ncbi:ARS-binding protein 1 [Glycine max]|nr:ARS-binding protein 1 [Glycine max]